MAEAATAKQKLTAKQWGILLTVIIMYFFSPTFNAVSSTLSLMPDYYGISAATVSWINVIANPSACVAGLLVGIVVGKKISYRACAIVATALFSVFGALPFIWQDIPFGALLVSRLLFGLGCGCFNPLVQAVITHMFESETARAAWVGVINIVFSIGASCGTMITGALSVSGVWQNAYAFYLLCLIPFVLSIIFLKDKDILAGKADKSLEEDLAASAPAEKRSLPPVAIAFICTFTLSTILSSIFFGYAGIAMAESGANTLLIGTVFTMFTVAGVVVAAGNAFMWKFLRLWNFPLSFGLMGLGYVFCLIGYATGSTAMFFAASIVIGIGCCLGGMVMPMVMSVTVAPVALTLAIGLQEVARNLGSFLSAPWLQAVAGMFADTATVQFTGAVVLGVVGCLIGCVLAAKFNKQFKDTEMK